MYVIRISDLAVLTYAEAQAIELADGKCVVLGFSDEGLIDTGYAMLNMPNMPLPDGRYWKAVVGAVDFNDGKYFADWSIVPIDNDAEILAGKKLAEINQICGAEICKRFASVALGALHYYSCDQGDQLNIQGNVLLATQGRSARHICYTELGERVVVEHSPEQMKKVGEDMSDHIWRQLGRANNLRDLINGFVAANDIEGLIALNWDSVAA